MRAVRRCSPGVRAGRSSKALQFASAFETVHEFADEPGAVADPCATLAVHAGIAVADAICCARLGYYSVSERHHDALAILEKADPAQVRSLRVLLDLKTQAGYSHNSLTAASLQRADRAMRKLIGAMERLTPEVKRPSPHST